MNSTNPYEYRDYHPNERYNSINTPEANNIPNRNYQYNYSDAFKDCELTRKLLNNRLEKLQNSKKYVRSITQSVYPYQQNLMNLYSYNNLYHSRSQLSNPSLYHYQFMNPMYYPLEMPVNGSPLGMPRVEMGAPAEDCGELGGGLGVSEVLVLLKSLGKLKNTTIFNIENKEVVKHPDKGNHPSPGKPSIPEIREKVTVPETERPKKTKVVNDKKKDWWSLCRDFVHIYTYMSIGRKYSEFARNRDAIISKRTKEFAQDFEYLKDWMLAVLEPFIDNFNVFAESNAAFDNKNTINTIQRQSQNIIVMIKKFLENLVGKTDKLGNIPDKIQKILYKYIKDRGYFPKKYLSQFQINRINFDLFGRTKELNESQIGMILSYLLINGITVQKILLCLDEYPEFKDSNNILISAKYVGSIIHYLTRDTFQNDPITLREILSLLNYYRNYHIFNEKVEGVKDILNTNININDTDEFEQYLIPESNINSFWKYNGPFIETYKNFVYAWSCKLAKLIKLKFKGSDRNLAPIVRQRVPPNRRYEGNDVDNNDDLKHSNDE